MMGKNEGNRLSCVSKYFLYKRQLLVVTLEHGTCLLRVSQLGNPFVSLSHYHHLSHHTPLNHLKNTLVIIVLWVGFMSSSSQMLPSHHVVPSLNVQGKLSKSHVYHIVSVLFKLCFTILHHNLYYVSCR